MSVLSAGRATNCATSNCAGGFASAVYLANATDVDSVTTDADGKVTAITMVATATFFEFDFRDNTARYTESVTVDETTKVVSVECTLEMIWGCRNHADRNLIMDMAGQSCGMVAIWQERTGVTWIQGHVEKERFYLGGNESDSGATLTDPNQETVTLRCLSRAKAVEFTPGVAGIPL